MLKRLKEDVLLHLNIILIGVRIYVRPPLKLINCPGSTLGLFSSHSRMTQGLVSIANSGTILKTGFTKSQMAKVQHFVSMGNQ